MMFCLDDGAELLYGPADDRGKLTENEPLTALLRDAAPLSEARTPPQRGLSTDLERKKERSIAVLPFSNLSPDPQDEFFCDGLAEELLGSLARIDGLKVASRTSAFSFKGKDAKVAEIARALAVTFILEGSVRRSADKLRINVQLIDAANDRPVWSQRYDRELKDIFDVQDEIALSVVDALKVKLLGVQRSALLKRYTDNPLAYELFLKGRFHWYKHTPEDVRKSLGYFQETIALDPDYAPGHAGLAEFYGISSALSLMDPSQGWPLAERSLKRALELDDAIPEIHNGLAAVKGIFYRDARGAELELQRAMELNPRFAEAHSLRSFLLVAQGRFDEAIEEASKALILDPLSTSYQRYLGWWFHFARNFDEAIVRYRMIIKSHPDVSRVHMDLRDALLQTGRKAEAVEAWRQEAINTADGEMILALGSPETADEVLARGAKLELERLEKLLGSGEWVAPVEFARSYVRLGDYRNAVSWLERASEVRDCFSLLMPYDPFYDLLRHDPRFEHIAPRNNVTQ